VKELELFNRISVDRKLRMIELKKEIGEVLVRAGEKPRYDYAWNFQSTCIRQRRLDSSNRCGSEPGGRPRRERAACV